ncbi:galectin [Aphelenchoides avenae]|nr:galectin [Aphelenchus avenae]
MSIGGGAGYAPTGLGSGVGFGSGIGSGVRVHFGSFSSASSFYNPSLPFQVPVNGFAGDSRIRVVLVPHPDAARFAINFYRGDDILLHFNPRFTEDQIVLNSTRNGSYQEEERRPNTLQRGEVYTIEFIAETGNAIRVSNP